MKKKHTSLLVSIALFLSPCIILGQNIGINTDGSVAETGVLLDLKGANAKTVASSQTLFQIKSNDASTSELKLRLLLTGAAAVASRYAQIDIADYTAGTPTYVPLLFQPSGGNTGIGTTSPTTTALLTITPTANALRNGIDMTLTGATSTATGINITTGNLNVNGITVTHSSSSLASSLYGIAGVLSSTNIVSGYNAYRNGSGLSYGIYGINGTNASYATNASTWAAFLQGRTVISSESSPTSPVGTDLEVRNTTTGAAAPATVSLRQTNTLTTTGNILSNLNFGDNHSTSPQAQIQVIRGAAGAAGDLPTSMIFYTTPDGSTTLTERMRITNAGNVGIGGTPFSTTFLDIYPTAGMTEGTYITMPNNGINASTGLIVQNNNTSQVGNKTGFQAIVGGADGALNTKRGFYSQVNGNDGTAYGGRFEALLTAGTNYGVYGYASGAAVSNYGLFSEVNPALGTNNYAAYFKGGAIGIEEIAATPSNPASSTEAKIYLKGDKLVIQFNDAGTVRYKYLDLTGTGVIWVHTTTAP